MRVTENLWNIRRKWDIPRGLDCVNDYGYVLPGSRRQGSLASINHMHVPQFAAYG